MVVGRRVDARWVWPAIKGRVVRSPQTLSEADRRLIAAWAADCAERVLGIFEAEAPDDDRPRALIAPDPRVRPGRAKHRGGDPPSVCRWRRCG
ncbi:putative immunity protein [Jatrophihabitans lederbergiae]|uniref:putative immunity protein n=1 Tax=Jatrophihabitans lederbergiae TaxID=3075547 RepID=UPI0037C06C8D